MLPSQWVSIGCAALTAILAALGFVDITFHTVLLTNPITLSILTFLGALGIHQNIATNKVMKALRRP